MSSLPDFLAARLPFPGLAAWGARLPDHSLAQQCYTQWLTPDQVQQALTRLTVAATSLRQHHLEPARLCWVFEHLRIYLASRADGAAVALFVENRPDVPAEVVEDVFKGFAQPPASAAEDAQANGLTHG